MEEEGGPRGPPCLSIQTGKLALALERGVSEQHPVGCGEVELRLGLGIDSFKTATSSSSSTGRQAQGTVFWKKWWGEGFQHIKKM